MRCPSNIDRNLTTKNRHRVSEDMSEYPAPISEETISTRCTCFRHKTFGGHTNGYCNIVVFLGAGPCHPGGSHGLLAGMVTGSSNIHSPTINLLQNFIHTHVYMPRRAMIFGEAIASQPGMQPASQPVNQKATQLTSAIQPVKQTNRHTVSQPSRQTESQSVSQTANQPSRHA